MRQAGKGVKLACDCNLDGRSNADNAAWLNPLYVNYFEADNLANNLTASASTTDWGEKLDHLFRVNPRSIAHGAYSFDAANSDHRWYQMYV